MKIGIVGYQGAGKSLLFEWLTGVASDPARELHLAQSAMATVPDPRFDPLCEVYQPKKMTHAVLELVDTPGLARDQEGNAGRLALIREAGALLVLVPAYDGSDPAADLTRLGDDLLLADLDIVTRRIEKLRESVKKPRPGREDDQAELEALEPIAARLEAGQPVGRSEMSDEQLRATRSFGLLTEKAWLVVINTADDEEQPAALIEKVVAARPTCQGRVHAVPIGLEMELARMDEADRNEFIEEMGLTPADRDQLIRAILDVSGQMLFFTAGEKEVRTWLLPQGGTALDAADGIHTDLARGFIRAEVMPSADLIRLGSERELKAAGLMRQEPKDYVVQEGDVVLVKFSV